MVLSIVVSYELNDQLITILDANMVRRILVGGGRCVTSRYVVDYDGPLMRDICNNFIIHELPNGDYGAIGISIGDTLEPLTDITKQECINCGYTIDENGYHNYVFEMTVKGALD
jgi:hypothetical protein